MLLFIKRLLLSLLKSASIYFIIYGLQNWIIKNLEYVDNSNLEPSNVPLSGLRIFNYFIKIPHKIADVLKSFANAKRLGPSLAIFKFMSCLIFDFGLFEALIQALLEIADQNCYLPQNLPKVESAKLKFELPIVDEILTPVWKTNLYTIEEQEFLSYGIKQKLLNSADGMSDISDIQDCTKAILIITFLFEWLSKINPQKFNALIRLLLELLKKGKLSKRVLKLLMRYFQLKGLPISLDFLDLFEI